MAAKDKTVAYYYDQEVGNFNDVNLMRPHRVRLAHQLIDGYDMGARMLVHRPSKTAVEEMEQFHADDYIEFLSKVTPDSQSEYLEQMRRFNLGAAGEADCPVFDGMFDYFQIYTGGSVGGAAMLNDGTADICVNWAGGAHHAKKAEASGFCYINDIVLAILELLKTHQRVLYVDIDIHHGDGVEEAFLMTNRVMTVSFHKYGDFFPGTGALDDVGLANGRNYSINVPLQEGMDDESYRYVYEPVMQKVMEVYQPSVIIVCSGADSLAGDRLGCFNLSLEGHSACIEFLAKFNLPLLVVGGGGYTMRNVSRCWCYETGRLLGLDLPNELPAKALSGTDYWLDTHKLRISVSNMKNSNSRAALEAIRNTVLANLASLGAAPSAAIAPRPPAHKMAEPPEEDMDVRGGGAAADDRRIIKDGYASDDDAGARDLDMPDAQPSTTTAAKALNFGVKTEAANGDALPLSAPLHRSIIAAAAEGGEALQAAASEGLPPDTGGSIAKPGRIAGAGVVSGAEHSPAGELRVLHPSAAAAPQLLDGTLIEPPSKSPSPAQGEFPPPVAPAPGSKTPPLRTATPPPMPAPTQAPPAPKPHADDSMQL